MRINVEQEIAESVAELIQQRFPGAKAQIRPGPDLGKREIKIVGPTDEEINRIILEARAGQNLQSVSLEKETAMSQQPQNKSASEVYDVKSLEEQVVMEGGQLVQKIGRITDAKLATAKVELERKINAVEGELNRAKSEGASSQKDWENKFNGEIENLKSKQQQLMDEIAKANGLLKALEAYFLSGKK